MKKTIPYSRIKDVIIWHKSPNTFSSLDEARAALGLDWFIVNGTTANLKDCSPDIPYKAGGLVYPAGATLYNGIAMSPPNVFRANYGGVGSPHFIPQCYGLLWTDGKITTSSGVADNTHRTAIGIANGGVWVNVTMANKTVKAVLEEAKSDGCTIAVNLDGGGSSQFYDPDTGVAYYGTDPKRKCLNWVCFRLNAPQPPEKKFLVAVDSGHGLETAGKRTPPLKEDIIVGGRVVRKKGEAIREKEFNRPCADALIKALDRCGIGTVDVSPGTSDVPLKDRTDAANKAKAGLLVSLHYNASDKGCWWDGGYTVGLVAATLGPQAGTRKFAKAVMGEVSKVVPWKSYGVQDDTSFVGSLHMLRQSAMGAVLVETGFMDVWESAKKMLDPSHQTAVAEAVCRGVCEWLGVKYATPGNSPQPSPQPAPEPPAPPVAPVSPYMVRITASGLNVREGPSTDLKVNFVIKDRGSYTIVAESKGKGASAWGLLKSGAGWISLDFTERI